MKLRLDLRLSQKLIMTPQLQQAIKLLQLSRLELQQSLQQHLMENPLLDELVTETEENEEAAATDREQSETPIYRIERHAAVMATTSRPRAERMPKSFLPPAGKIILIRIYVAVKRNTIPRRKRSFPPMNKPSRNSPHWKIIWSGSCPCRAFPIGRKPSGDSSSAILMMTDIFG